MNENSAELEVKIKSVTGRLPEKSTAGAAGYDLKAHLPGGDIELKPLDRFPVPTGLFIELPPGHEMQIRPRSGLALNHGISMPNCVGTIDSDYRGEILVLLINLGKESYVIKDGDRIAQAVFAKYEDAYFVEATELAVSERGGEGFGSTGK